MYCIPYFSRRSNSAIKMGYFIPAFFEKAVTASTFFPSVERAIISKPWPLYVSYIWFRKGTALRQEGQKVAQKSRTTTFPLLADRRSLNSFAPMVLISCPSARGARESKKKRVGTQRAKRRLRIRMSPLFS